jgi:hypothetical protein
MENNVTSNTVPLLYTEEDKPVEQTALYTVEDIQTPKMG